MARTDRPEETIDWALTTWDGARREAMRRWARLPLERVIAALEEMQALAELLTDSRALGRHAGTQAVAAREQRKEYGPERADRSESGEDKDR